MNLSRKQKTSGQVDTKSKAEIIERCRVRPNNWEGKGTASQRGAAPWHWRTSALDQLFADDGELETAFANMEFEEDDFTDCDSELEEALNDC